VQVGTPTGAPRSSKDALQMWVKTSCFVEGLFATKLISKRLHVDGTWNYIYIYTPPVRSSKQVEHPHQPIDYVDGLGRPTKTYPNLCWSAPVFV